MKTKTINLYQKYKIIKNKLKIKQLHQLNPQEKAEEKILKQTVIPYKTN